MVERMNRAPALFQKTASSIGESNLGAADMLEIDAASAGRYGQKLLGISFLPILGVKSKERAIMKSCVSTIGLGIAVFAFFGFSPPRPVAN